MKIILFYFVTHFIGNISVRSTHAIGIIPSDDMKVVVRKSININQEVVGFEFVVYTPINPINI